MIKNTVIDLKNAINYIDQYVRLRNSYTKLLLTSPVSIVETREWLKKNDIEVWGIVENNILLGIAILYLSKDGEISFFAKDQNKGIGSKLLSIIENVASNKGLKYVWSWVLSDNHIAHRVFEKKGFTKEKADDREYNGMIKNGIEYKKRIGFHKED